MSRSGTLPAHVLLLAASLASCADDPVAPGAEPGRPSDAGDPAEDARRVPPVDADGDARDVAGGDDAGWPRHDASADAVPSTDAGTDGAAPPTDAGTDDVGALADAGSSDATRSPDAAAVALGTTPIFADMFSPQNVDGTVLERWTVSGFCQPTRTLAGAFCLGRGDDANLMTRLSTAGYSGLVVSYTRVPNLDGAYDDGEYFAAEWSRDGGATWVEIERSVAVEGQRVDADLPEAAEGQPDLLLRFRVHADSGDGNETFWLDDVVVTATVPVCTGHVWTERFDVPFEDVNGELVGGAEVFRIVPHDGELFAANTYWIDESCPWYGPGDQWAQLLRKPGPDAPWQEDYELGAGVLRPEVLRSVTFAAPDPDVTLLLAATFRIERGRYYIDVWTRDDEAGRWERVTPHEGPNPADSHDVSVRQLVVHEDGVTGQELIILSVGTQGMLEGRYDPEVPGRIAWGPLVPVAYNGRAMGMSVANGVVVVGAGNQVWHRTDGPEPGYVLVHDMEDLVADDALEPPMGTFRGMSTIRNPAGPGQSLLFSWAPDHRSPGTIYRLDPDGEGYARLAETCIGDLLAADLGVPVWTSLCTYSYFLPVTDPDTGAEKHLGGCLNAIGGDRYPVWSGGPGSGLYAGGIYFVRHEDASYTVREVAGRHDGIADPRDGVRALARSPFPDDDEVYFGGHDSSGVVSTNLAWMYSAPLRDVLEVCAE